METDIEANKHIVINEQGDRLIIEIDHSGLQGKISNGGTNKLVYILLGTHCFAYVLLLGIEHNLIFTLFSYILRLLFSLWEINIIWLILYSCFGFTRIKLDRDSFTIEKGLWAIKREVMGETDNIKEAKIDPVSVFRDQYRSFSYLFSSSKTVSYACYLLQDPAYSFGAMSDRHSIEKIAARINSYLKSFK